MQAPMPKREVTVCIHDGLIMIYYIDNDDVLKYIDREGSKYGYITHDPLRYRSILYVNPCYDIEEVAQYFARQFMSVEDAIAEDLLKDVDM